MKQAGLSRTNLKTNHTTIDRHISATKSKARYTLRAWLFFPLSNLLIEIDFVVKYEKEDFMSKNFR
jgi:hypothetical protein